VTPPSVLSWRKLQSLSSKQDCFIRQNKIISVQKITREGTQRQAGEPDGVSSRRLPQRNLRRRLLHPKTLPKEVLHSSRLYVPLWVNNVHVSVQLSVQLWSAVSVMRHRLPFTRCFRGKDLSILWKTDLLIFYFLLARFPSPPHEHLGGGANTKVRETWMQFKRLVILYIWPVVPVSNVLHAFMGDIWLIWNDYITSLSLEDYMASINLKTH